LVEFGPDVPYAPPSWTTCQRGTRRWPDHTDLHQSWKQWGHGTV